MSFTISVFNHAKWSEFELQDFGDFADQIAECNVGEDAFSGYGEWFFVPDEPLPSGYRAIYFGSWGNDHSPGASLYTNAELFDLADPGDVIEFKVRLKQWQRKPEFNGD